MGCNSSVAPSHPLQKQAQLQQCHICNQKGYDLPKLTCTHYSHETCLLQKKLSSNQCTCGTVIGKLNNISETAHQLYLAYQAKMIAQKNQNQLNQVFHCPKKGCSFYFIQVRKLELGQNKEFYCDQCNCKIQYDYNLQKSDYTNEKSYAQAIPKQVQAQQSNKRSKDYSQELQKIIESIKLPIKQCKNNCGFMYIENDSYDICNSLCQNCNFCFNCNRLLFSDCISIKNSQRKFHFLCALSLINDPDKLKSLQLQQKYEKTIENEDIKITLDIHCMICRKYDKKLEQFPCQHYIHLDCISNNSVQFSDFKCFICNIPILEFLSLPQHNQIHDKIKQSNRDKLLMQIAKDCFICLKQSEELLFDTSCKHKVHYSCLKVKQAEITNKQQPLKCNCGEQICDIRHIIS